MKTKHILFILFLAISGMISAETLVVDHDMTIDAPGDYDEIWVVNDAILTIENTKITMLNRIVVYPKAKLIIDNSTITKRQYYDHWWGIATKTEHTDIFYRCEIEIKNGSIIENAVYGVDLSGISKLMIDNAIFRYNSYGVHLRAYLEDNQEISIQNTTFEENRTGIEMHRQNEEIEIAYCNFYGNNTGIFFNGDVPESLVSVIDCKFYGSYGIYAQGLYDLKVEDSDFYSKFGIVAKNSEGLEIIGNRFYETSNYGVRLVNSECEIKNNNEFTSSHGVLAMSTQPGNGCVKITDGNYFNSEEHAIDLSGMDSPEKSEITDNYFSNCQTTISIEGSNYYIVNDNTFDNNDISIFASATGYNENEILCNSIDQTSEYGIELKNDNYSTTFMGNYFTYGGLADITIDGTTENHIGDDGHPAENHFSTGSGDIKVSDYTPYFHYFLAPDAAPDTDPDNIDYDDIPESWEMTTFGDYETPYCVMPPGTVDTDFKKWWEYYCTLWGEYHNNKSKTLYKKIKHLEVKLHRVIFIMSGKDEFTYRIILDILLRYCETYFSQKTMFYLYLNNGDFEKADSVLNVIEYTLQEPVGSTEMDTLERISKESFVNINRIGIRYYRDTTVVDTLLRSDTLFNFTEAELATLYQETYRGIPESAYAKTLYFIGTGELLMFERGERNIEPRSMTDKNNDKVEEVSIYPNPSSEKLFIINNVQDLAEKLYIYDMYGIKMIDKNIINVKNVIDVSQLPEGIYVLSVEDNKGKTIKTEKIVINHK